MRPSRAARTRPRRSNAAGRWPESSWTTWRPTPTSTGTCRAWNWPAVPPAASRPGRSRTKTTGPASCSPPLTKTSPSATAPRTDSKARCCKAGEPATDFELAVEAERLADRLLFLMTLARLWKLAASSLGSATLLDGERDGVLAGWLAQAQANLQGLTELLEAVDRYRIPRPRATQESLVEYDRRRAHQGAPAGADHRHLRGNGRRRPLAPRRDGSARAGRRAGRLGGAGAARLAGDLPRRRQRRAPRLARAGRPRWPRSRCCTWP